MKAKEPSILFIASVVVAMITLYLSTGSLLALCLLPLYLSALVIHTRLPRDSALIWGGRLFVYASCAILGRAPIQSYYYFGAQAFVTMGLILGGELILQSFREPPEGFKFDPLQFFVSSLLFLVGCGTFAPQLGLLSHLWITAPLWVALTLLAMTDVREGRSQITPLARVRQFGLLAITVCLGYLGHSALSNNRNSFMSLTARLLSEGRPNVSEVGTADAPTLSSSFNTNASTARMLRIDGSLSDSHLRAGAFDQYSNGTWGPPLSSRNITTTLPDVTREYKKYAPGGNPTDIDTRTDWTAKITVLRDTDKNIFMPLNISALIPIEGISMDWYRYAGPIQISDPAPFSYGIVESRTDIQGVQTEQGPLCVAPNDYAAGAPADALSHLTEVPREVDPEVKTLADQIVRNANARTQQQKIDAISKYLLTNYKYSLDFVRGTQDPISDFLLNKKSAHCQYFASSAVMLMREEGIPARYVSGYWAHEAAPDGSTIVRGRDAHAWAEAYIDKVGWVTVETTPPSGRADPQANPISWYQKMQEKFEDQWARIRNWFGNLSSLQIAGIMLGVLGIWSVERWRQARKRARNRPTKTLPPLELQPLARGFEAVLKKRGITLLDGQTWSEAVPSDWQQGVDFVEHYNTARFAERDEERLRDLTFKLRSIQKEKK